MSAALDTRYFDWLYSQVCGVEDSPRGNYTNLLEVLYGTEYLWLVPNDDNRVEDGRDLRYEFFDAEGVSRREIDPVWLALGCSIFELLIGLSRRLEFETNGRTVASWFWEMLSNLGLGDLDNSTNFDEEYVNDILSRFIWRNYKPNGSGGLFPLQNPKEDQREVELWYQLNAYILEQGY